MDPGLQGRQQHQHQQQHQQCMCVLFFGKHAVLHQNQRGASTQHTQPVHCQTTNSAVAAVCLRREPDVCAHGGPTPEVGMMGWHGGASSPTSCLWAERAAAVKRSLTCAKQCHPLSQLWVDTQRVTQEGNVAGHACRHTSSTTHMVTETGVSSVCRPARNYVCRERL